MDEVCVSADAQHANAGVHLAHPDLAPTQSPVSTTLGSPESTTEDSMEGAGVSEGGVGSSETGPPASSMRTPSRP